MRKLELKDIAAYLPYEVTFHHYEDGMKQGELILTPLTLSIAEGEGWEIKLVLRPIEDITIENEGMGLYDSVFAAIDFLGWDRHVLSVAHSNPEKLSYEDVQKLCKWHFDVFKLIPNGKAISIHDIKE